MSPNPPRFVPTLTESLARAGSDIPDTVPDDSHYLKDEPEFSDSMIDLDLEELEAGIAAAKVSHVSPMAQYQTMANMAVRPKPGAAAPRAEASQPTQSVPPPPASAASPGNVAAAMQGRHILGLPDDWQKQMQQAIGQAVRHELQQQMPFLLLQWSRQIEERVTPQVEQHILQLMQTWYQQKR